MFPKKLWVFPLLFGIIGAFIGLVLRYAYTGGITIPFNFKYILHAHSHIMLLGFLFNALLVFVWSNFTKGIDEISYRYYIAMQMCMALMVVAFILQGYALFSILFSTLHLWISYILLVRLWKRLKGEKEILLLIKVGIVFHFLSSLGPYALGPLMVLDLKNSPWYQQSVFFYLHFQFLGIYFIWMLALLAKKVKLKINKKVVIGISTSLVLLYAHTLDYSFDHWAIQLFGGIGSVLLFVLLLKFRFSFISQSKGIRNIYYIVLVVALINIAGTFPMIAELVVNNRFILIAWLHFLFLGLYVPFIWVFLNKKITLWIWIVYLISVIITEFVLLFPALSLEWTSISSMDLLFYSYLLLFMALSLIHILLFKESEDKNNLNQIK
ncbi:MAG: hypothetical protein J7K34_00830 [Flavobacteriaceae bacterium]|nr:hypothetical protein [Flavobacteriaceae bacterium]